MKKLDKKTKESLRYCIAELNIKQSAIAQDLGIAASVLSDSLRAVGNRNMSDDKVALLKEILLRHIQKYQPKLLNKVFSAERSHWSILDHRIDNLDYTRIEAGQPLQSSSNGDYVHNPSFRRIIHHQFVILTGGPKTGKTSALNIMEEFSKSSGVATLSIDLFDLLQKRGTDELSSSEITDFILSAFPNTDDETCPQPENEENKIRAIIAGMKNLNTFKDNQHGFSLFIDNMHVLYDLPHGYDACTSAINTITRGVSSERNGRVTFTEDGRLSGMRHVKLDHPISFELPTLRPQSIAELYYRVTGLITNETSYVTKEIFKQFSGQPYLTHSALQMIEDHRFDHDTVEKATDAVIKDIDKAISTDEPLGSMALIRIRKWAKETNAHIDSLAKAGDIKPDDLRSYFNGGAQPQQVTDLQRLYLQTPSLNTPFMQKVIG